MEHIEQRVIDEAETTEGKIRAAVGMAVGAGSVCWERVEDAGVFQSERASAITDEATAAILELLQGKG